MGSCGGSGAHLAEIVRTAVGEFTLDHAVTLADLAHDARAGRLLERVLPLGNLLPDLPRVSVLPFIESACAMARTSIAACANSGWTRQRPPGAPAELDSGEWKPTRVRVFNQQDQLIAIAEPVVPRTYQPVLVLEAAP